jgi:Asp-tRNA(Asn)/Glu-tRNA(Gln) amidotransferase A subunit family amidase
MVEYLADAPLVPLARSLRIGDRDPEEYAEQLRRRVRTVDPNIRALVDEPNRWERVTADLATIRDRYPERGDRPSLYGIPVGVKDIFRVEGLETRAGSDVSPGELAGDEAPVVTALTEAGAIVLGKTVTTEFAYLSPGPTRNPHDREHTPGGSSSGSAAAVAAGFCPLALGSQTIGSVIRPAAYCGVVGVKPTYGRLPTDGVFPLAPSVDHVGYFVNDVQGAALAAGVLYPDWIAEDEPPELNRIGVVDGPYLDQAASRSREQFESHVDRLTEAGYETVRTTVFPNIEDVNERHETLVAGEAALSHDELFPRYGDDYDQETADLIRDGREIATGELATARTGRAALREQIHATMDDRELDLIVSPATPDSAPAGIDSTGDPVMNLPWTHAGMPTATLPASKTDAGLPMGLQCATRFGFDEWLLSWCRDVAHALAGPT